MCVCFFQEYTKDPVRNWKNKDSALYLVTSLASKGQTQKVRVFISQLMKVNMKLCKSSCVLIAFGLYSYSTVFWYSEHPQRIDACVFSKA